MARPQISASTCADGELESVSQIVMKLEVPAERRQRTVVAIQRALLKYRVSVKQIKETRGGKKQNTEALALADVARTVAKLQKLLLRAIKPWRPNAPLEPMHLSADARELMRTLAERLDRLPRHLRLPLERSLHEGNCSVDQTRNSIDYGPVPVLPEAYNGQRPRERIKINFQLNAEVSADVADHFPNSHKDPSARLQLCTRTNGQFLRVVADRPSVEIDNINPLLRQLASLYSMTALARPGERKQRAKAVKRHAEIWVERRVQESMASQLTLEDEIENESKEKTTNPPLNIHEIRVMHKESHRKTNSEHGSRGLGRRPGSPQDDLAFALIQVIWTGAGRRPSRKKGEPSAPFEQFVEFVEDVLQLADPKRDAGLSSDAAKKAWARFLRAQRQMKAEAAGWT